MGVLVVVLVLTNLVTLATVVVWSRRRGRPDESGDSSEVLTAPRPPGVSARNRRLITIEIRNPIELASTRAGRIAGIAGTLVPGLTQRLVYDQTIKTLRRELDRQAVLADVRVHTLRSVSRPSGTPPGRPTVDAVVVDEVAPLDLTKPPRD